MTSILDESAADKQVIASLRKEIRRLIKLIERINPMSKVLMDTDGNLYIAELCELITEDQAVEQVQQAESQVEKIKEALEFSKKLRAQNDNVASAPAATPAPEQAPQAATPEGMAPVAPQAPVAPAPEFPGAPTLPQ